MVVYRATPADVASGVRVGDVEYPGFPASGAGVDRRRSGDQGRLLRAALRPAAEHADRGLRARRGRQRGEGRVRRQRVREAVQEEPHRDRRRFINRVVPEILEHSPELKMTAPAQDSPEMLAAFLKVNGELRRSTRTRLRRSPPRRRRQSSGTGRSSSSATRKVEAGFADHRTYIYKGKEIDQQIHLGFDLAVTAHVPVVAANAGTCSTRAGSASTATASSSTTAWACSRSTATCRRSTSRSATR